MNLKPYIQEVRKTIKDKVVDIDKLLALRWKRKGGSQWTKLIESPDGKVILKKGYISYNAFPPEGSYVPTYRFNKRDMYGYTLQAKARAGAVSQKKAWEYFSSKTNDKEFSSFDLHKGNVGIYKGKPVLIDW